MPKTHPAAMFIDLLRRIGSGSAFARISATLFAILIVPLLATSLVLYQSSADVIERAASAEIAGRVGDVREAVDALTREIELIVVSFAANRNVSDFLTRTVYEFQTWEMVTTVRAIQDGLSLITRPYIRSIAVYSELNDYVISAERGYRYSLEPTTGWHERLLAERNERGYLAWFPPPGTDGGDSYAFYVPLPLYGGRGVRGSMLISVGTPELLRTLRIGDLEALGAVTIVTDEQRVFYSSDRSRVGEPASTSGDDLGRGPAPSVAVTGQSGWVVSILPHEQRLRSQKVRLLRLLILGLIGTLLVSVVITTVLANRLYSPVGRLVALIEQHGQGKLAAFSTAQPNGKHRYNEYEYIAQNVLSSMEANANLSGELTRALSLFKEYHTKALQSQINPHFLLNTLQVINWEAIELSGGENRVTELLRSLSELLEIAMDIDNTVIPLRTEKRYVERYCEIMQTRYQNLFKVEMDFDDDLLDCLVVKMSLQPLVENAIYHGLKPRGTPGTIRITTVRQSRLFRLQVEDDGIGISASQLAAVNAMLRNDPYAAGATADPDLVRGAGNSIGIANVHHRTRTLFGSRYGVSIQARSGGGVRAVLTLPYDYDRGST